MLFALNIEHRYKKYGFLGVNCISSFVPLCHFAGVEEYRWGNKHRIEMGIKEKWEQIFNLRVRLCVGQ